MFFDESELGTYRKGGASRAAFNRPTILKRLEYAPKARCFLTKEEVEALPLGETVMFDVELYRNYFLVAFKVVRLNAYFYFEHCYDTTFNLYDLGRLMWAVRLVGFNSRNYDLHIIKAMLEGASLDELKELSDKIILENNRPFLRHDYNHIDLIEVAPLQASLKAYGARLHCERLQELPFDPHKDLTREEADFVRDYCFNDLDVTEALWNELLPQIELRILLSNEYNIDLRSKSDAQIAEAIINTELEKLNGGCSLKAPDLPHDYSFFYQIPDCISYHSSDLCAMLETLRSTRFTLDGGGSPAMPKELSSLSIRIGSGVYRMGIGGLHSSEKTSAFVADDTTLILDRDVASYYPYIILNQRLYPDHLGEAFLIVYQSLVTRRLSLKAAKNILEAALKITINGTFGKLGNMYSTIYSPNLLSQVTISGQLYLLMLIDMLEYNRFEVVSANTDGLVTKCPAVRYEEFCAVVEQWETITGFKTEETRYAGLFCRDVNNYIAVKTNGETKAKGTYSERGSALNSVLSKNPMHVICSDAVQAFLSRGVPIEQTIRECADIRRFVCVQNVRGGAHKGGVYLGKVVRWYYPVQGSGAIHYITTGNTVPRSEAAEPLMQLAGMPADLNYARYIGIANEMLYDVGFYKPEPEPDLLSLI